MILSQIGLLLNFIAGLGWAIQTFRESHKNVKGKVLQLYEEQQKRYKKERDRNVIWLVLLCLGFLLQLIESIN
mgnify:CR=1 FL=1